MIWHIFKKDFRLLWPLVLIVAAAEAMSDTTWVVAGFFLEPRSLRTIAALLSLGLVIGIAALIVSAVHQDVLPGDRQDWLVRPIRRRDLILAKILFVLLAAHGPYFLIDLAQGMSMGFSFWASLLAALARGIHLLWVFSLPVLAIAAITSTIVEVTGALMVIALALIAFITVMQVSTPAFAEHTFSAMSGHWLMLLLWSAGGLVAALVVIPLQYFRRRTMTARVIALSALLILPLLSAAIPWSSAFAFEQWLSPDPAAARPVTIAFDPSLGRVVLKPDMPRKEDSVWLPIRLSGLQPNAIVLNDRTIARIIGQDGAIIYSGLSVGDDVTTGSAVTFIDAFPPKPSSGDTVGNHQFVILPRKVYESVRSQPVRLELDYWFSLSRLEDSDTIPALNGTRQISGLGQCKTKLDDDGDEVMVACVRTSYLPTACDTAALENPVTGKQNPLSSHCSTDWLPDNTHYYPNALTYALFDLPFRDPQGLAKYPVDSAQLAQARVSIKAYKPVARFTRHLVIPEIRLGDWEAQTQTVSPPALAR
jgi:hypothetical protein